MKRYSEYKDSRVKWIGEIPITWTIRRTRFLCDICTGDKDTVMREDNGIYPFYVRSPKVERINSYSYDGEAILMAGDGVGAGKVFHYANGKFDYHQRVYNLHNIKDILGKYFFYYIRDRFHYAMEENNAKSTVDSVRLPWLKAFPVCLPPIKEQQAIVSYLDNKVAKINQYIAVAETKIKALEDLKQAIISDAVTHGINPNAKMKYSGIKWIGMVPEHWEVVRLKHKYSFKTGATPSTGKEDYFNGELRWANISDLNQRVVYDTANHISEKAATKCSMSISPKGSLMYSFKLSVGNVAFCGNDMYTNEAIATFERGDNSLEYLYYIAPVFIIHNAKRNIYNALLLNKELIKNAWICLPPASEQRAIISYLDRKVSQIDQLRAKELTQIEKLEEYKQRLISDAVTGKVRVATD